MCNIEKAVRADGAEDPKDRKHIRRIQKWSMQTER